MVMGVCAFIMLGCAPQMDAVWKKEGYSSEWPSKVAIVAVSKSMEVRQRLENSIAEELTKQYPTIEVVKGVTLFPPNSGREGWSLLNISSVIEKEKVGSVLTAAVVNSYVTEDTSTSYYVPQYYGMGRHLITTYDMVYGFDYTRQDVNYVLESSLFDLREGNGKETLVWKVEDKVINPSSVASGSDTYAKNLVKYMAKNLYPPNN